MGFVTIDDSYLTQIADAIRLKSGNLGDTRTETTTTIVVEEEPIVKVLKTMNAIDFTTADPNMYYYYYSSAGYYPDPNQALINEDTRSWKVATIQGASKIEIDIGYQTSQGSYGSDGNPSGDWLEFMPEITTEFNPATGQRILSGDLDLHRTTLTFEGTDSISMRMRTSSYGADRKGFLGYYAEIRGYDEDNLVITETVEREEVTEEIVPNTYTPAQMGPAILKLQPEPYIAFIELSGMQEAFFNEPFTTDGLQVTGYFSDESSSIVTGWTSSIENGTSLEPGRYTVTITYTDDNGITASANYEINVYELNLVSWADGDGESIKSMIAAADAGRIKLSDYWSVGDEKIISFRADSITSADNAILAELGFEDDFTYERTLVLVHRDPEDYQLVETTEARSIPNFVVQFKENSVYSGQMNQTYNITKYSDTAISLLLDQIWYNNLPDWLKDIIKTVKVQCWLPTKPPSHNFEGLYYLECKLFLPSRNEITDYGYGDDGVERWEYYLLNPLNMLKHAPNSSVNTPWLTRTCMMQFAQELGGQWPCFQVITGEDSQTQVFANERPYRISPAFCI